MIRIGPDIQLRKIDHIPVFAGSIPSSLSLFLSETRPRRWFTWNELKSIAYLKAWPDLLQNGPPRGQVLLLDQGPVFRLATLLEFGPPIPRTGAPGRWWSSLYAAWAGTLDMVVWLDASDAVLMKRINTRGKDHHLKGRSGAEARQVLGRYRNAYLDVLSTLTAYNGPAVLSFDTEQVPVDQIAGEILKAIRHALGEGGS